MKHRVLKRERIRTELNNIFNYPLTVVVAAMGYGKTTSVRDFLDEMNLNYAWLAVESDETSAQYIWGSLTRQLAKTQPELGNWLNALGFPIDAPQRYGIISTIEDYTYPTNTVLVIDDYHFAHAPELDRLFEAIVRANISGLRVLIISRIRPAIHIEELRLKGYCYLFKSSLFELSSDEIIKYFKLFGHDLSATTAAQVHRMSEGWIAALYLILQRYREVGRIEPGRTIESLIETAVMSRYTEEEARLLMTLCVLDSFTPQQAAHVTGDSAVMGIMERLSDSNSLIRYDERMDVYRIHNMFREYLKKRLEGRFDGYELGSLYKRSGEWHIESGNVLSGLKFFLKAKEYDLILAEFEKPGITRVIDRDPTSIVELFEKIPVEAKYRHPIGYLTYADFYLTRVDMEGGAWLLAEIEQYYQDDDRAPPELKRRIFGEIELARNLLCFNDLRKMHELQLKAHELLDGRSSIVNKDMLFTFGSPHTLYLYYREKGELLWIVEYLDNRFHYYQEVANGLGTGFEYQARAEYCLETGDLDGAGLNARKAIYKAQTMEQISISICANLTLARLLAARGQFDQAKEVMDDLSAELPEYNNPVFNSTLDLCKGYLGGISGEPQSFAGWLCSGDMKHSEILYQGMAFNYIIHAKYVLLAGNHIQLEVLCDEMQSLFSMFNNLLGYLHTHIMDAVAKYRLYGMEKAKAAMLPALDIGRADAIILPFAEYGVHILDILKALQKENGSDGYLNRLVSEATSYSANVKRHRRKSSTYTPLTEREKEVLQLVAAGKTNREIAAGLFIAEVTVRKNLTSIYRKLNVGGRAAAVKKAVELKAT